MADVLRRDRRRLGSGCAQACGLRELRDPVGGPARLVARRPCHRLQPRRRAAWPAVALDRGGDRRRGAASDALPCADLRRRRPGVVARRTVARLQPARRALHDSPGRLAPHAARPGRGSEWSPDGRQIAFDGAGGVGIVNADGSGRRLLSDRPAAAGGPGVPSWSPDGTKIAFFATPGTRAHFRAEVWTINADGSAQTLAYSSGCCVGLWAAPVWSPDGRLLAFSADSAGGVYVMHADGTGLRRLARAYPGALAWQVVPAR